MERSTLEQTIDLLRQILSNEITNFENINYIALVESFSKGLYLNHKLSVNKSQLSFEISDDNVFFTVDMILEDNDYLVSIKKNKL